jgi:hypothetical protein
MAAGLLDLPLEVLTDVCQQLDLFGLVRVSGTCTRFRHCDDGPNTVEVPAKLPVVTALCALAFPRRELDPSTRPVGCSESWVTYLARCARQGSCREAPLMAAGNDHSVFIDSTGQLLSCGEGVAVGHRDATTSFSDPTPVAAMAKFRVRSVAAEKSHRLALGWDGRVFSWGLSYVEVLGREDDEDTLTPARVEGLEDVRGYHHAWLSQSCRDALGIRLSLGLCSPVRNAKRAPSGPCGGARSRSACAPRV